MRRLTILIVTSLFLATACAPQEGIEVRDAWARSAAQGDNGAVYFVIHNYSAEDDSLIGASSDVADSVEVHESSMTGNVMEMHMVHNILLAPGEDIEFAPGGLHLMLVNLKQDLEIGGTVGIILHFENHPDLAVSIDIKSGPEDDN